MAEKGDVGLVAESSRSTQRLVLPPPALTAGGVFAKFRDIAQLAGSAVSGWAAGPLQTLSRPSPDPLLLGTWKALVPLLRAGSPRSCFWDQSFSPPAALRTAGLSS